MTNKYDMSYKPIVFKSFFEKHLGRDITHIIEEMVNWHIYTLYHDSKSLTSNVTEMEIDRLHIYGQCHIQVDYIRELVLMDPTMTFKVKYADIIYCAYAMPDTPIECRVVYNTFFSLHNINAKIIVTNAIEARDYINTHLVVAISLNDTQCPMLNGLDPNRFVVVRYLTRMQFERIDNNPLWPGKSAHQIIHGYRGQQLE